MTSPPEPTCGSRFDIRPVDGGPRDSYWLEALARLADGVSLDQAQADMDRIMAELAAEYPDSNTGMGGYVEPLLATSMGETRQQLLIFQGVVGLLLLISGVNVSNLLLMRASSRGGEVALRAALGASTGRLVRQLVTENLLLSVAGGFAGLILAAVALPPIIGLGAGTIARLDEVSVDRTVLAFSIAVSLGAGLVFGLLPALRVARGDVSAALRAGGKLDVSVSTSCVF